MSYNKVTALLFVFCLAPSIAFSQTINATNPASIVDALQSLGYRAQLERDSVGDPLVKSAMEGIEYSIIFYGCRENKDCQFLNFTAGFDLRDGIPIARVNEWNRGKVFGKAYIEDENDPFVQMAVTTVGGLNQENFEDVVDWWRVIISTFKEHIDW